MRKTAVDHPPFTAAMRRRSPSDLRIHSPAVRISRHRRRRLHRFAATSARCSADRYAGLRVGAPGHGSGQAHLLRQPANLARWPTTQRLDFVHGDICDAAWSTRWCAGHDAIVHFAAESHVDRSIAGAATFVMTNVLGTQVLLDAALRHGVGRFLHVSTDEVYGSIDDGLVDRGLAAGAELAVRGRRRPARTCWRWPTTAPTGWTWWSPAAPTTTGRTSSRRRSSRCSSPTCSTAGQVPLYGDGGNIRDWLHVDDHCRGHRSWRWRRAGRARSTTSAAAPS